MRRWLAGGLGLLVPLLGLLARHEYRISSSRAWTRKRWTQLWPHEARALWRRCPSAQLEQLQGEFAGWSLGGDRERTARVVEQILAQGGGTAPGAWRGKAFRFEAGARSGEGYNLFEAGGGEMVRSHRFRTFLGPALEDGAPALLMAYGAFDNTFGDQDTVDAIRSLGPGLFLGSATFLGAGGELRGPLLFLLEGPKQPAPGVDDAAAEVCRERPSRVAWPTDRGCS